MMQTLETMESNKNQFNVSTQLKIKRVESNIQKALEFELGEYERQIFSSVCCSGI